MEAHTQALRTRDGRVHQRAMLAWTMAPTSRSAPLALVASVPVLVFACGPSGAARAPSAAGAPRAAVSSLAPIASPSAATSATAKAPSRECEHARAMRARVPKLLDQGRLDRARRVLQFAASECPRDAAEGLAPLARVLVELDRFDEAAATIDALDKRDLPADAKQIAREQRARLAKLDAKPTDAVAAKELAAARALEAEELQNRGDPRQALAKWRAAWEASHPNGDALLQAARAARDDGDPVEAQRLFDRAVVDYERESGRPLALYTENGLALPPSDVAWTDGGRTLVVAEGDALLAIDARSWTPRTKIDGLGATVYAVALSADGKTAACALDDGTVPIVDLGRGVVVRTVAAHAEPVNAVAISADGKLVAAASTDQTVSLIDVDTGTKLRVLKGHGDSVTQVAFSPDHARVASGSNDGTVRLWDVASGRELKVLKGHVDGVTSIAWSPDGKLLATGAGDGVVRVMTAAHLKVEKILRGQTLGVTVSFSADSRRLAAISLDESARVYEVGSWRAKAKLAVRGATAAALAPDGRSIAVVAGSDAVDVFALPTGTLAHTIKRHAEPIDALAVRPTAGAPTFALASWDGTVRTWSLLGDAPPETLVESTEPMRAVAFSRDGKTLATGGDRENVRLWDVASRAPIGAIRGLSGGVREVALTADGARVAWTSGTTDRFVSVGDRGKSTATLGLYGHKGVVDAVAWSPDATTLASGADDTLVALWDPVKGQRRAALKGHRKGVTALAWSPDGATLASGSADSTIELWSPSAEADKAALRTLTGHTRDVRAVAFSPDGSRLASGGYDRSVRLWDLASGASRALDEAADWISAVAFTADGTRLLSAGRDGTVRLFDVEDGRLRVSLRAVASAGYGYAFTPEGLFEALPKGSEARRYAMCRIGSRLFSLELCAERFVLDGLVAKIAAGDASYLEP